MTQLLNVDIRTIFVLLCLGNLAASLLVLAYGGRRREAPETLLGLAKLFQGLAWPLLALRGDIPDLLSFSLGNALLLTGYWLEAACAGALDRPTRLAPTVLWALAAACAAGLILGPLVSSPNMRVVVISLPAACCFGLAGLRLLRGTEAPSRLRKALGCLYLLVCALVLWRALLALTTPGATLFTPLLSHALVYLPLYTLMFAGSFGLLLLFKERTDQTLARLAAHDALTGAPNRRALLEKAGHLCAKARRESSPLAVLMLDLDHFKRINDTRGHLAGDEVLRHFARTIAQGLRSYDAYGRFGGEEFVALLPDATLESAKSVAERIRAASEASADKAPALEPYTVSIGVALGIPGPDGLEPLLALADQAMYQAKSLGRNRVQVAQAFLPEPEAQNP